MCPLWTQGCNWIYKQVSYHNIFTLSQLQWILIWRLGQRVWLYWKHTFMTNRPLLWNCCNDISTRKAVSHVLAYHLLLMLQNFCFLVLTMPAFMALLIAMSDSQLVCHFGPDWNISTTITWVHGFEEIKLPPISDHAIL